MTRRGLEKKEENYEKNGCMGRHFGRIGLRFFGPYCRGFDLGVGILRERLPTWVGGGERLVSAAIMKAEEILPGVKEKVKEVAPGLKETVEKMIPGIEIPGKDVGGEDLKPIPRYGNMIRVSYSMENQKKTISYKER
jgi:hypothetical protein